MEKVDFLNFEAADLKEINLFIFKESSVTFSAKMRQQNWYVSIPFSKKKKKNAGDFKCTTPPAL